MFAANAFAAGTLPRPGSRYVSLTGPASGFRRDKVLLTLTAFGLVGDDDVTLILDQLFDGGLVYPDTVTLSAAAPSATIEFTPAVAGTLTLDFFSDRPDIGDPPPFNFESIPTITALSLAGPTSGALNVDTDLFTVTFDGAVVFPFTITPVATGPGAFTPASLNIAIGQTSATFRWRPTQSGVWQVGLANNAGVTNPPAISFGAGLPPVLAATTIARGALTRTGAGGVPMRLLMEQPTSGGAKTWAITAGNAAGHWQIDANTGEVTPTAGGQGNLAGPYNLSIRATNDSGQATAVLTINTRADTYTVSRPIEVDGIGAGQLRNAANRNNLSGKRVEIARRTPYFAQADYDLTNGSGAPSTTGKPPTTPALRIQGFGTNPVDRNTGAPSGVQDPNNVYADFVTFGNEDNGDPAEIRDCVLNGSRRIRLSGLRFRYRSNVPGSTVAYMLLVATSNSFGVPSFIDIEDCDFGTPGDSLRDCVGAISIRGAFVTSPADARRAISVDPTSFALAASNINIRRNRLNYVMNGIVVGNATDVLVEGNVTDNFCSNAMFFGLAFNRRCTVRGNIVRSPQIHPLRLDDHRDMCQVGSTLVDRWWEDFDIDGNIFDQASGGGDAQGPFFNDCGYSSLGAQHDAARGDVNAGVKPLTDPLGLIAGTAGRLGGAAGTGAWAKVQWPTGYGTRRVKIRNNLIISIMQNAIVADVGDDWLVENNTVLTPPRFAVSPLLLAYADSSGKDFGRAYPPKIILSGLRDLTRGIDARPTNVKVRRNIAPPVVSVTPGPSLVAFDNLFLPDPVNLPARNAGEALSAYHTRYNAALSADRAALYRTLFTGMPADALLALYPTADKLAIFRPGAAAMLPDGNTWTGAVSPAGALGTPAAAFALAMPQSYDPLIAGQGRSVTLAIYGDFAGVIRVTPRASAPGTFVPAFVDLTAGANSAPVLFTPAEAGIYTVTPDNNGGLAAAGFDIEVQPPNIDLAASPLTAVAALAAQVEARPQLGAVLTTLGGLTVTDFNVAPFIGGTLGGVVALSGQIQARPQIAVDFLIAGQLSAQLVAQPLLSADFTIAGGISARLDATAYIGGDLGIVGTLSAALQARPELAADFAARASLAWGDFDLFTPLAASFAVTAGLFATLQVRAIPADEESADDRVIARQREPLDALVWRATGATTTMEATLALNPHLAALADALPQGTRVRVAPLTSTAPGPSRQVQLWD